MTIFALACTKDVEEPIDSGFGITEPFCSDSFYAGSAAQDMAIDSIDHCVSSTNRLVKSSSTLDDLDIYGYNSSADPGGSSVRARRDDGPNPGTSSSYRTTSPGTSGADWAVASGLVSGTLACDPGSSTDCTGTYHADIKKGVASSCGGYDDIAFCARWGDLSGGSKNYDSDTSCSSGSGRFRLAAWQRDDRDGDGDYGYVLIPIQKSGTGNMTNAAWVTEIDIVEDEGNSLHVQKVDAAIRFNGSDQIDAPSASVHALSATNAFSSGQIRGNPSFVLEDVTPAAAAYEVDMTWTCSTTGFSDIDQPRGYVFNSSDIGCGYDQDFILRPIAGGSVVQLQVYGNPLLELETHSSQNGIERDFEFNRGEIHVEGSLISWGATSLLLDIDVMEVEGLSVCTSGRYTLSAE